MFDLLHGHILKRVGLTDKEFQTAAGFFLPRNLRKHQFLLQEGDVCKYVAFVTKGCLRQYSVDDDGEEHIMQFAVEDWWISDMYSQLTGEPSTYFIDALEDSELLLLDRPSQEKLLTTVPKMERFFRLLLERNFIASQRRINAALSMPAQQRYLLFLKTYPTIAARIPQRHIASYLGITPEALSRIRKNLSQKGE